MISSRCRWSRLALTVMRLVKLRRWREVFQLTRVVEFRPSRGRVNTISDRGVLSGPNSCGRTYFCNNATSICCRIEKVERSLKMQKKVPHNLAYSWGMVKSVGQSLNQLHHTFLHSKRKISVNFTVNRMWPQVVFNNFHIMNTYFKAWLFLPFWSQ